MTASRADKVAQRLEELLGQEVTTPPKRVSSGASRETWAFATADGDLVAQFDRGGHLVERPPQGPLLRAAADAGVPVPELVAFGDDWTVARAVSGTTDPATILGSDADPAELLDSIAAALAAVHRMPADEQLAPPAGDPLAILRALHDGLGEPHPVFELAFLELDARRPASTRRTLVHGDYRLGNLLVDGDAISAVLDWEQAHIGDPAEDVGWLCVPAWRFSRQDRPAAGLGSHEELLTAYERHSGVEIDHEDLAWWELFGTLRWGVITVMQAHAHLSGAIRSVEHAVIGRRTCEVEWDLLELLDPDGASLQACTAEARDDTLHDRPTVNELLDAARSALGDDVLPELNGRAAFQTRVTMRALGIVQRQLAAAAADDALRTKVLQGLGAGDERELAAAVRAGGFADREPELHASLRALVRAKLAAANPRYLSSLGPVRRFGVVHLREQRKRCQQRDGTDAPDGGVSLRRLERRLGQ